MASSHCNGASGYVIFASPQTKTCSHPKAPMLTLKDSVEILRIVMPKKKLSFEEAAELIYKKHLNRFRSRNCRLQKKQIWLKENGFLA
jgi:hypothetical protein